MPNTLIITVKPTEIPPCWYEEVPTQLPLVPQLTLYMETEKPQPDTMAIPLTFRLPLVLETPGKPPPLLLEYQTPPNPDKSLFGRALPFSYTIA